MQQKKCVHFYSELQIALHIYSSMASACVQTSCFLSFYNEIYLSNGRFISSLSCLNFLSNVVDFVVMFCVCLSGV